MIILKRGGAVNKSVLKAAVSFFLLAAVLAAFWMGGIIMGGSDSDTVLKDEMIDYVVILGCRLEGKEPGKCLNTRIDGAVKYLRSHSWSMAVCSGGQGSDEEISEAEAIAAELKRRGIPERRILIEDKSTSTYENLVNTKKLLDARKGETPYRTVIVTNEFHAYRTRALAKHVGFDTPAVISVKSSVGTFCSGLLREIAAVPYTFFKYGIRL